jgi:hypothetical protein
VCECISAADQTLSYPAPHNWPLTAILLLHKNRTRVCIAARAFSALCAFYAVLLRFFFGEDTTWITSSFSIRD